MQGVQDRGGGSVLKHMTEHRVSQATQQMRRYTKVYMISAFIMRSASSGLTALSSPIEAKM